MSAVEITWTRADGQALIPVVQSGQELRIINASSAMEGIFVCNVSNSAGFNSASINITVICKSYIKDMES